MRCARFLFGGYRSTDTATATTLERVHIPSDNHAWSKFYNATEPEQLHAV